jgi:FixJ family two-component response regulator
MAAGKRNSEIATILKLSERTVEKHAQKLFEKLGVETRGAAGNWWQEQLLAHELARVRNGEQLSSYHGRSSAINAT